MEYREQAKLDRYTSQRDANDEGQLDGDCLETDWIKSAKELVEPDIPNIVLPVQSNAGCVRRMNKYIRVCMMS